MSSDFERERSAAIAKYSADPEFLEVSRKWLRLALERRYVHSFSWMGRPIIQSPADILALQEVICAVRPDLIIETGIAHGGSLMLYASLCRALGNGRVVGVDVEIRPHNRRAIEEHALSDLIELIEGSSTDASVAARVRQIAANSDSVLVILDSNHTKDHVLAELRLYSPLVSVGSYCIVMDTVVEELPSGFFKDRDWDVGNNPSNAVEAFLAMNPQFEIDRGFEAKLMISASRGGFLRRVK